MGTYLAPGLSISTHIYFRSGWVIHKILVSASVPESYPPHNSKFNFWACPYRLRSGSFIKFQIKQYTLCFLHCVTHDYMRKHYSITDLQAIYSFPLRIQCVFSIIWEVKARCQNLDFFNLLWGNLDTGLDLIDIWNLKSGLSITVLRLAFV